MILCCALSVQLSVSWYSTPLTTCCVAAGMDSSARGPEREGTVTVDPGALTALTTQEAAATTAGLEGSAGVGPPGVCSSERPPERAAWERSVGKEM